MGLDMYLYRKTYVQNWDHMKASAKHKITVKKGGKVRKDIKPERICYIIEQVGYWRKANHIHKWFVDNVQGGVDNCEEFFVELTKLQELLEVCKLVINTVETVKGDVCTGEMWTPGQDGWRKILRDGNVVAQAKIAADLLPRQSGFFFGGTDYDEFYLQDIMDTIDIIEPLVLDTDSSFYYQSSW